MEKKAQEVYSSRKIVHFVETKGVKLCTNEGKHPNAKKKICTAGMEGLQ